MTGTVNDILGFPLIALAAEGPSGPSVNLDFIDGTDDFVADVNLTNVDVADVGAYLDPIECTVRGTAIRFDAYCDLWLSTNEGSAPTRYLLGTAA